MKKQVTDKLIQLMKYAHQAFSEWCHNLKTSGKTEIQLEKMLDLINHLHGDNGEEKEQSTATESASTDHKPDTTSISETPVSIGGISIPAELYNIFVIESKQHLATLEKELNVLLAAHPAKITQPFTLAMHTLASTSGALKLDFVAGLSSKLEEWLTKLREANTQLKESDTHLIQNCIQHIGELLHKVHQQQFPDETDLQLAQFLSQEVTRHQIGDRKLTQIAPSTEPINLSEYRFKKALSSTPLGTSPKKTQEEITDDILDTISSELLQAFFEEVQKIPYLKSAQNYVPGAFCRKTKKSALVCFGYYIR